VDHGDRAQSAEDHRLFDRDSCRLEDAVLRSVLAKRRDELLRGALAAHAHGDVARVLEAGLGDRHAVAAGAGADAAILAVILDAFECAAADGDIIAGDQFDC
jgi:hypothetical protein